MNLAGFIKSDLKFTQTEKITTVIYLFNDQSTKQAGAQQRYLNNLVKIT